PTPTPVGTDRSYALSGSSTLKTLVKGSLPLSGSIKVHSAAATGPFTGDLTLAQTSGNLTALGFLPVNATVAMVPTEQVTGTVAGGVLNATAKVRIKLPSIKSFGIQLAGGANCQATQVSSIPLKSSGTAYDPAVGGTLAGTFSISNLSGCGALNGIISPLTAGGGNAIALKLTPTPAA
ncbi:MAG: hypothetical protein REI11_18845, partial [Patulibacter sp.]|nr:hypothetical protein [Patulibacter sp.]